MMIVCPNCKKRFDIDPGRVEEDKKLRCSSCRAVFRLVRKPRPADAPPPVQAPVQAAAQAPLAAAAQAPAQPAVQAHAQPSAQAPATPAMQASAQPAELPVAERAAAEGAPSIHSVAAAASVLKVVVANESLPFCDAVRKVLADEPFEVVTCNDGKVALDTVERLRPDVLLLDVALPTMFGFEVCERIRQNPELADLKIVLIASIYDKTRYKRSPNSLYGADDYIEKHHIPDSLVPMIHRLASGRLQVAHSHTPQELADQQETRSHLRQVEVKETTPDSADDEPAAHVQPPLETLGLEAAVADRHHEHSPAPAADRGIAAAPAPVAPTSSPRVVPAEPPAAAAEEVALQEIDPFAELAQELASEATPAAAPVPPAPAAPARQLSEAEVKAKRLARIIVSDIVLYNQGKVEQGVREGTFYQLLADDIREGERLYRQRVAEEVRESTTFLKDAFEDLIAKKRAELRV